MSGEKKDILEQFEDEMAAAIEEAEKSHDFSALKLLLDQIGQIREKLTALPENKEESVEAVANVTAEASPNELPTIDLTGDVQESFADVCRHCSHAMATVELFITTSDENERRRQLTEARAPIVQHLQQQIDRLAGEEKSVGTETNEAIVTELRETLKDRKMSVMCKCGFPGLPYFTKKDGCFRVAHHYRDGDKTKRTYHGGPVTVPQYRVVQRPMETLPEKPPNPPKKRRRT